MDNPLGITFYDARSRPSHMVLVSGEAGKTAVLLYTMPFWVILLAWPILGERIRGLEWLAVILAFAGLVCIVAV